MITSTVKQLPKSTAELEIKISWDEIREVYEKIFNKVAGEVEIEGFRKGKAPKELVEKRINKAKLYEEVIKEVVPAAYSKALAENKLTPVSSPKIEVAKAKENEDWVVKAQVALKPKILLKNYKEKIKELKKSKVKIWTPGKGQEKKKEDNKPTLDEIINTILSEVEVELSDLLINEEANRLLANLVDQTQKLGLTVEQYLISKGKTSEQLRAEYAKQAAKNLSIEFALAEIADKENITVTPEDLEKIIAKVEKPEEREKLKQDSYYLAHLLRQQKTLDFLSNL
jgi:FKBP-type peptidyl-prolyl cis-trans isomerase (trigger factor)